MCCTRTLWLDFSVEYARSTSSHSPMPRFRLSRLVAEPNRKRLIERQGVVDVGVDAAVVARRARRSASERCSPLAGAALMFGVSNESTPLTLRLKDALVLHQRAAAADKHVAFCSGPRTGVNGLRPLSESPRTA